MAIECVVLLAAGVWLFFCAHTRPREWITCVMSEAMFSDCWSMIHFSNCLLRLCVCWCVGVFSFLCGGFKVEQVSLPFSKLENASLPRVAFLASSLHEVSHCRAKEWLSLWVGLLRPCAAQVLDAPQLQDDFYLNLVDWCAAAEIISTAGEQISVRCRLL